MHGLPLRFNMVFKLVIKALYVTFLEKLRRSRQFLYLRLLSQQSTEIFWFWSLIAKLKQRQVDQNVVIFGTLSAFKQQIIPFANMRTRLRILTMGPFPKILTLSRSFFNLSRNFTKLAFFVTRYYQHEKKHTFVFIREITTTATKICFRAEVVDTSCYSVLNSFSLLLLEIAFCSRSRYLIARSRMTKSTW